MQIDAAAAYSELKSLYGDRVVENAFLRRAVEQQAVEIDGLRQRLAQPAPAAAVDELAPNGHTSVGRE
jgi:hypothetical protein